MISAGSQHENMVILDSGSDVSLLPLRYVQDGDGPVDDSVQLRDAQGERLKVKGYKTVSLVVRDNQGVEAELERCFLVGDVKSCILSLGQLYQGGWHVRRENTNFFWEALMENFKCQCFSNETHWLFMPMSAGLEQCDRATFDGSSSAAASCSISG